jgi:hypothetical protein
MSRLQSFLFPRLRHPETSTFVSVLLFAFVILVSPLLSAQVPVVVPCTPTFSDCGPIPENTEFVFAPGLFAVAGDAILVPSNELQSNDHAVSDVFHIDNNFLNTGLGTGLGFSFTTNPLKGFLFSGNNNTLPNPSTYAANATPFREAPQGHGDTQYLGNGTDYHLGTSVAANQGGSKTVAHAKNATIDLVDGSSVAVSAGSGTQIGQGLDQDPDQADGLAFYSTTYASLGGVPLPFKIVGTNPANGAATTTVPTFIVPIKVVFTDGNPAKGTLNGTLDGSSVVSATQNSPIFLNADYTVGGTNLGNTQWSDALQRGEFHNIAGFSPDYHVLLGTPTVMPTQTVTVSDPHQGNLYRLRSGGLLGVLASGVLESQVINPIIRASSTLSSTLPMFLTDNVFESADGTINTCCVLGYHNSQRPPASSAKTWIYDAYTEAGTFRNNVILDVQPLSHEVAEWLNDPFVGALAIGFVNLIPPAILPGQGGACIINFETGDPLEAPPAVLTKVTNGTTYHLQDEVFLPWYLHSTPSFSVNGQFSLNNTFTRPSSLCGPG